MVVVRRVDEVVEVVVGTVTASGSVVVVVVGATTPRVVEVVEAVSAVVTGPPPLKMVEIVWTAAVSPSASTD